MKPPPGKPLPPKFKHEYKYSWFRRLTLKERLLVALGCNVQLHVHWFTAHSAGATQPVIKAVVTKHATPADQFIADTFEVVQQLENDLRPPNAR